ncbi:phytoene desaturase family protein [Roseibacillus ishigakijimensis]|uniref:Phytoene desaturase n=1 Tax=Roseibacillus ishigakijimensis TaxID=454146 RepID=A0A934RUB3_9BACT|nr:phytoene desaturase family protein [Roseibacillus ishigakijimensis]MBK1835558.1 phytoene desaturase [Roseibacillus ishigakijimensis]
MRKKIIIVGAGPGGLVSGMLLAHRGYQVTLLEKGATVGGRNAPLVAGDYRFDTGPTFLHQKFTLDEIFAEIGRKADEHIPFQKLDPMTKLTWEGVSLETSSDREKMAAAIEKAFPGEAENYRRFMRDHAHKLQAIFPCLLKPYHQLSSLFASHLLKALPHVATNKTVMDVLDGYFDDERLKLAFTFQAKYLGMSPWNCPGLFSILSYIEYEYGIYHVEGGLSKMSEIMADIFQEEGGQLMLESEVTSFQYQGDRVSGVVLADGQVLSCDDLIVNADYAHARSLIFGERKTEPETLAKKKFSCSTYMLYLGLDKIYQEEPHHHIIFADNYAQNVADIQSEKTISDDMSIYVRNSSINDKTVAPEGHSQLYFLVPTINNREGDQWTEEMREQYREKVLDRVIAKTGMKDLREHIVEERCITPTDWESADIFLGATFNLAHTLDQMLYLRPRNKLQGFENIYLVGGGTHPGSGLPTIFESARISANLIDEAYGTKRDRIDFASELLAATSARA